MLMTINVWMNELTNEWMNERTSERGQAQSTLVYIGHNLHIAYHTWCFFFSANGIDIQKL